MTAKFFVVAIASLALVNTIAACASSWPCGGPARAVGPAWKSWPVAATGSCSLGAVAVDNGGALDVTSASALAPSGISIVSDNDINGCVDVAGALPLLAAVGFEGNLPTAGSAGTSYCCGSGNIGISSESLAAAGIGASSGRAGFGAYGNAGLTNNLAGRLIASGPGCGCGCGGLYY